MAKPVSSDIVFFVQLPVDHFTVVCSIYRPLNESEAGVNNASIQTSLFFLCISCCNVNKCYLYKKRSEVCIKARLIPASLVFKGLVTEHSTVKN